MGTDFAEKDFGSKELEEEHLREMEQAQALQEKRHETAAETGFDHLAADDGD
ncbi:hypothetical protein [Zhihengliuella sp.]|uniref:hypothetical protein n=1 Tax=Zhihengliuella sp. TaxID=1954483 RepID=UPI0028111877|nr:hypothetical protein [Zhihengliuella sp.]